MSQSSMHILCSTFVSAKIRHGNLKTSVFNFCGSRCLVDGTDCRIQGQKRHSDGNVSIYVIRFIYHTYYM